MVLLVMIATRRKLIGFCGRKGSGKDTAAAALTGRGWERFAFADPFKDMLTVLLRLRGMPEPAILEVLHGRRKEEPLAELNGRSTRYAMQTIGTEWGRDLIHPDLWTDALRDRVRHSRQNVAVTDIRMPNEAALIRELGGKVVRINRERNDEPDHHISEAIDRLDWDIMISNHRDIAHLHYQVLRVADKMEQA